MELRREAIELIETYARWQPSRANLAERQSLIERLAREYGIWNGYGGEGSHSWYTGQGERIGPLQPDIRDIEALAGSLGVTFSAADNTFDLDKQGDPSFVGTYTKTPAGIASAYRGLLLHQQILQKIAEGAFARETTGEVTPAP